MKSFTDPLHSMIRDAAFKAERPPERIHETHSAKEIEAFRERQRQAYKVWRFKS